MEKLEVDYEELSTLTKKLSSVQDQIQNSGFDQVPVGDAVYGFPVLAQAVQAFAQCLTERTEHARVRMQNSQTGIENSVRNYQKTDQETARHKNALLSQLIETAQRIESDLSPINSGPGLLEGIGIGHD